MRTIQGDPPRGTPAPLCRCERGACSRKRIHSISPTARTTSRPWCSCSRADARLFLFAADFSKHLLSRPPLNFRLAFVSDVLPLRFAHSPHTGPPQCERLLANVIPVSFTHSTGNPTEVTLLVHHPEHRRAGILVVCRCRSVLPRRSPCRLG